MRLMTGSFLLALAGPEDGYEALLDEAAKKEQLRVEERLAAHEALDAGDYDRSVALAKHAKQLEGEIADARDRARLSLRLLVPKLVELLDDDAFEVREESSSRLRRIGAPALPALARLRPGLSSAEARCRVDALLGGVRIDEDGLVRQWASAAVASSEYMAGDWSAKQAVGAPDSAEMDSRTAWAAKEADGGEEWLQLTFPLTVTPTRIRIHENLTPGGIVRIDGVGEDGVRRPLWRGRDLGLSWFDEAVSGPPLRGLVVVLDTRRQAGWEEIDAVELIGAAAPEK